MVQHAASAGANAVIGMRYTPTRLPMGSPRSWPMARRWWCNRDKQAASIGDDRTRRAIYGPGT
jgi:hypothetical protein